MNKLGTNIGPKLASKFRVSNRKLLPLRNKNTTANNNNHTHRYKRGHDLSPRSRSNFNDTTSSRFNSTSKFYDTWVHFCTCIHIGADSKSSVTNSRLNRHKSRINRYEVDPTVHQLQNELYSMLLKYDKTYVCNHANFRN